MSAQKCCVLSYWVLKPYNHVLVNREVPVLLVVLRGGLIHSACSHNSHMDKDSLDFSSKDKQKKLLSCPSVHHNVVVDKLTLEMRNAAFYLLLA